MVVVTKKKKKFKTALKKFLHTHFTQLKSTLVNRELWTVSQEFIIVVCDLRFYVHYVSTIELFFKLS